MSPSLKTVPIELTQGKVALVSECDYSLIAARRWHAVTCSGHFYARSGGTYMHRALMKGSLQGRLVVDHINGDGLDNRRENLRVVTATQNNLNKNVVRSSTGLRGVYAQRGRYLVRIGETYRGFYADINEAAHEANKLLDTMMPGVGRRNPVDKAALIQLLQARADELLRVIEELQA